MAHHTALSYYREYGAAGGKLDEWGLADGENGWDKNDPHGLYFSGTAASNTTIRQPRNIYRYRNR